MINNINNCYKHINKSTTHQLYAVVRSSISYLIEELLPIAIEKDASYASRVKKFIETNVKEYIERNEENPLLTSYDKHENMLRKVNRRISKINSI